MSDEQGWPNIAAHALNAAPAQPLPVRVNNACQRCRRNRSRCDAFRPCSLCLRGNAECISVPVVKPNHVSNKRRRTSTEQAGQLSLTHSPSRTKASAVKAGQVHTSSLDIAGPDKQSLNDDIAIKYAEADSTIGIARKIFLLGDHKIDRHITSAIPDGSSGAENMLQGPHMRDRQPIEVILGWKLPALDIMVILLEEYFTSVHFFSLVIFEPKFRLQFDSIVDGNASPSQKGFLILLSMVMGLASWYRSQRHCENEPQTKEYWVMWNSTLFQQVESQILDLMDRNTLASIQTCVLLGTFYVYHGRPNLSLSLLGAMIKASQAIGLHRGPDRGTLNDIEERKRVWWTIYVWDRFASITYGKPLSITDEDCNVTMPSDFEERPTFRTDNSIQDEVSICYSAYQREVSVLYMIASPMIETIFGIRSSRFAGHTTGSQYSLLARNITHRLREWRSRLPEYLICNFDNDIPRNTSSATKAHRLQALALQLTFDNIIIILYRPVLAQQVDQLSKGSPSETQRSTGQTPDQKLSESGHTIHALQDPESSQAEQWWSAAVRTSQVTELPQLAQLATDSHLVAFLAINLFHSAIVMAVCALSDPLSNRAQETKRNITRIYRLQVLLGQRSQLSMQSGFVLQDVIKLLLAREAEAMLSPAIRTTMGQEPLVSTPALGQGAENMSVEDTLRLPLNMLPRQSTNGIELQAEGQATNEQLFRLNDSLAHVQRVLPNINGNDHQSDEYGQRASAQQFVNMESWMSDTTGMGMAGMEWDQMNQSEDQSGGLYWMWNSLGMPNSPPADGAL